MIDRTLTTPIVTSEKYIKHIKLFHIYVYIKILNNQFNPCTILDEFQWRSNLHSKELIS